MAEFKFFNYAQALGDVENIKGARLKNQLNVYKIDEVENKLEKRAQFEKIMGQHEDDLVRIDALEDAGLHEEARELAESWMKIEKGGLDLMEAEAKGLSADTWDQYRYEKIQRGGPPYMFPEEYDPDWMNEKRQKSTAAITRLTQTYGTDEGPRSVDILQRGGTELERGAPYDPKEARATAKTDSGRKWTASDSNSIRNGVASHFNGTWDPTTGGFRILDPELRDKATRISSRADELMQGGTYKTHNQAINAALDEAGETVKGSKDPLNLGL